MASVGHDALISLTLRRLINAANQFGEKITIQVRKENADGVGALSDEAASTAVRRIVQPGRDFPDTSPGLRRDQICTGEGPGRRGNGDFGDTRNILDCHGQIGISGFSGLNRLGNTRIPGMDCPTDFFGAAQRLRNNFDPMQTFAKFSICARGDWSRCLRQLEWELAKIRGKGGEAVSGS